MDYQPIINLLISYIEIEKQTNKTKPRKVETIIKKCRVVLPPDIFIEYYYFILYFLDIYLI
jgi:hypothetical protein